MQKQNNHKGIIVMPTIVPSILKLVKNCLAKKEKKKVSKKFFF